jgi:outer membrane protein assembly factor BamB
MRKALRMPAGGSRRATTRMARLPAAAGGALLCVLLATLTPAPAARAQAAWTTYHHDSLRSGADPEEGQPTVPSLAWHSADLGAPIWGQPLLFGSRVYTATVGDVIYALDAASGAVIWSRSVGTPVPAKALACGDVVPTVGIVGTPLIDPATNVIYAVADTWDATSKEAHHVLVGLSLSDGAQVLSIPVDPPGADPKALLQRTALNLDQGRLVFGFGGNDGDCGEYRGTVVSAPESAGAPLFWQVPIAPPSKSGGAVWAPSGPAVDGEGHIYATTGNPNPPSGQEAATYDYSDSIIELDPSLNLLGNFQTPNWSSESNSDLDLASAGAEPLPGGVLFQAGKAGVGYLVGQSTMASGAQALYSHQVCGGSGSFGGDSYAGGVIYIPCTSGVQALAYDQAARTFSSLWRGPSDAVGPPILSAGLVWTAATGGSKGGGTKLYGLDPSTGVPRYTETLPSPIADHFASPSAGGGRVVLATGSSLTAYTITDPAASAQPTGSSAPAATGLGGGPLATTPAATVVLLSKRLHATPGGRVRLRLRCRVAAGVCSGTVTLKARFVRPIRRGARRGHRVVLITLVRARFRHARGDFTITLRLDARARALLRRHRGGLQLRVSIAPSKGRVHVFSAVLR